MTPEQEYSFRLRNAYDRGYTRGLTGRDEVGTDINYTTGQEWKQWLIGWRKAQEEVRGQEQLAYELALRQEYLLSNVARTSMGDVVLSEEQVG